MEMSMARDGWEVGKKRLEGGRGGWSWPVFTRAPCYLNRWAWILPARSHSYCIPHDEWGLMPQLCRQLSAMRLCTQLNGKSFQKFMSHTQAAARALKLPINHVTPCVLLFLDLGKQMQRGLDLMSPFPPICTTTTLPLGSNTCISMRYAISS